MKLLVTAALLVLAVLFVTGARGRRQARRDGRLPEWRERRRRTMRRATTTYLVFLLGGAALQIGVYVATDENQSERAGGWWVAAWLVGLAVWWLAAGRSSGGRSNRGQSAG